MHFRFLKAPNDVLKATEIHFLSGASLNIVDFLFSGYMPIRNRTGKG